MANYKQYSRRNFFNKFNPNSLQKQLNSSSLLNPLNSISAELRRNLPPIEPEVLFLNRASFGIRPQDYASIKSIGIENYLEQQMDYESIDNTAIQEIFDFVYPLINYSLPELVEYIEEGDAIGEDRILDAASQLIMATMLKQIYSKHQLFEVMVEFWTNHFNTDLAKGLDLIFKSYEDKHIIRAHAFGNFREFLHADSMSSTMMYYLDNYTNTKFGPNENYARELMELHTLGVNGGYSEDDVKEVARCFTGWSIGDANDSYFQFFPENHDFESKFVLGHTISNTEGIADGQQVIDILADSSTTGSFIAKKLVKRFCSDQPDIDLVRAVTKTYMSTDGDIKSMLRTIFHSRQFLDSVDSKYKRPIEFVSSMFRSIDAESSHLSVSQKLEPATILIDEYQAAGQVPFLWAPPTGYPDSESYWANASSLLRRINLSNGVSLANLEYREEAGRNTYEDYIDYRYQDIVQNAETANEIVQAIEKNVLYRTLLDVDRQVLVDFLNQESSISEQKIRATIGLVLSSTYFQLR